MRPLGVISAILIVISFLAWLSGWIFWNFLVSQYSAGGSSAMVMQAITAASAAIEYLALLLIAIGLIIGGGRKSADSE